MKVPRDLLQAVRRVAEMSDKEILRFAKHDPDIFRDVARAAMPTGVLELFGNPPCDDCVHGFCTMNCSTAVMRRYDARYGVLDDNGPTTGD
jgi:hypothetical protein